MYSITRVATAVLFALLGLAAASPAAAQDPTGVVERVHEALLEAMKHADQLGFAGRRDQLGPVLESSYDFPFMAQKSAGRFWKNMDPAEQEKLTDALQRLAIATYAARFSGYDGERFETVGQEDASYGTVLVKTRIVQGNGETVALDYRLRPYGDGDWRIIDVFLNGTVSELAMRRSEYSSVLKRDGYDALIESLEGKIQEQERGETS